MNFIKLAFLSIAILFILISSIGILLPSNVLVSRAININTSKDTVFIYVNSIKQWSNWMDGMHQESVKISSATHADLAGIKVVINFISDSLIIATWTTQKGNIQTSSLRIIGDSLEKVTVVQWQFEQKLKWYPWERLGSIMNDKIIGSMMEKNLNNLKLLIEK